MGEILESKPIIKGDSKPINYLEKIYFPKINTILRNNNETNLHIDTNLEISLQKKVFIKSN